MHYETKKFKNGLTAIVVPMASTETATVLALVGTGSLYEQREINGISHYLEHLFFKGTKKRPTPGEVNRALDGMGAEHNAFTSKEMTGFWVKSAAEHYGKSLEIVSDILINPLFKAVEVERERGVILQEIAMYEDMPQRDVWSLFDEVMYGDTPAGWDIAGTPAIVKGIARPSILKYKAEQYVASNVVVVVAGNVNVKDAFRRIEDRFGKFAAGHPEKMPPVKFTQTAPRARAKHKNSDQTHFVLGLPAFDAFDERKYALKLLSIILGGNMSSRLFMTIREKLGLAYYVSAGANTSTYGGQFTVAAGVPHGKLRLAVKKTTDILASARAKGVTERELTLAKDYLRGMIALSFEPSDEVASFFGSQALLYKEILTPAELWARYETLTSADVSRVAAEILDPKLLNLAAIGPHKNLEFFLCSVTLQG
jgi:predicted Zn-dependent peptidase